MSEHVEHHILPLRIYLTVFAALMVLTVATVWVALYDLGLLNKFVAVTIATFKAYIVMLYFMHLRYNPRILWLAAASGFVWLLIMVALTFSDIMTRGWLPQPEAW